MKSHIDISDEDLNHLVKIFDVRQEGWVNHRDFVFPVYTELDREGVEDNKGKAEDFDQFVSSVVQWKRKAENDITKVVPQTEDGEEEEEKKSKKTKKIRPVPRRFATGSPYKKKEKETKSKKKKKKDVNQTSKTKKKNKTTFPNIHTTASTNNSGLFQSANRKTRPQIPAMSPSADSRLSEMSSLVDGLALRLEKEQKMNERLQAQLLRHQQQGEIMLMRLREEQRKRKDLRNKLMERASPESKAQERRRAEEKIRRELREELKKQIEREELKRPTNLGSFATLKRKNDRLRRKKEQQQERVYTTAKKRNNNSKSRAKTPSFMKAMSKTAKRTEQFEISDSRRVIYEQIRKRKFLFHFLESSQSKTNGLISYARVVVLLWCGMISFENLVLQIRRRRRRRRKTRRNRHQTHHSIRPNQQPDQRLNPLSTKTTTTTTRLRRKFEDYELNVQILSREDLRCIEM